MAKYTVEIGDSAGKSFQVALSINMLTNNGSWRSLDKGFIRHNSGTVRLGSQFAFGSSDLVFRASYEADWGLKLLSFIDEGLVGQLFTNDQGTGALAQPWVVTLTPGVLEWAIV